MFEPYDLELVSSAFGCSPATSQQIVRSGRIKSFAPRAYLIRQGDCGATTFLIVIGRAQAIIYSADGQAILLHEYSRGDLFGAFADASPDPQEADVLTMDEVRAFLLEATSLIRLAEQHGEIGLALSRLLLKRLRATSTRIYERTAISARGRVCAELLRLAGQGDGAVIRPLPILSDLALRVGTTRETVSRTVSALERRGILKRETGLFILVAPRRLEEEIL